MNNFLNIDWFNNFKSFFIESSNKIYLPRTYGLNKFGKATHQFDDPQSIQPIFKGTLRDYQKEPVDSYLQATRDELKNSGIINIPPGFGKTVIALYIISKLKYKTLIIVHKDFLLSQWKERIEQYLGNVTVGILKQNKIETFRSLPRATPGWLSTVPNCTFHQYVYLCKMRLLGFGVSDCSGPSHSPVLPFPVDSALTLIRQSTRKSYFFDRNLKTDFLQKYQNRSRPMRHARKLALQL